MYNESAIGIIFIVILIKLLFPELRKPIPSIGTINGDVIYNDAPVAGVVITLYTQDGASQLDDTKSDDRGKYELLSEANGEYHITGVKQNDDGSWLQADLDILVPNTGIDLVLERTTTI